MVAQPMYEWRFSAIPVNFLGVRDNPMHALLLQQPRLVRLLEKRALDLGVDVRWGHELVGLVPTSDGVTALRRPGRTTSTRPISSAPTAVAARSARSSESTFPEALRTRSRGSRTCTCPTSGPPRTADT
jgi:hypothetical protein